MKAHHRSQRGGRARPPSQIQSDPPARAMHGSSRVALAAVAALVAAAIVFLVDLDSAFSVLAAAMACAAALIAARSARIQAQANMRIAELNLQTAETQLRTAQLQLEAAHARNESENPAA